MMYLILHPRTLRLADTTPRSSRFQRRLNNKNKTSALRTAIGAALLSMICAAPASAALLATPFPESPLPADPSYNDGSWTDGNIPEVDFGWDDYLPLTGSISLAKNTRYFVSVDDTSTWKTSSFIRADRDYSDLTLSMGGSSLRFDIHGNIKTFASVDDGKSITFENGKFLQIRYSPTARASYLFNIKDGNSSLTIDVDDLWFEFDAKSSNAANIIYSLGKIDIRSKGDAVFLMDATQNVELNSHTVAIIQLTAGSFDHVIDGNRIFLKYGEELKTTKDNIGIQTEQVGGTLTIGSDSTELIQIANAKSALVTKTGAGSTTKLTANRIELIAPDQGGVAGIFGQAPNSTIQLGKSGSEVFITGFDSAIDIGYDISGGNPKVTLTTATLKLFESDGNLVSSGRSSLSITAEKIILNGDVSADKYASADIDFGTSGSWVGKATEVSHGSISAKMSSGTEWKLTGSSSLSNLEAEKAVIDISNHDENGLPQIDSENPITLSVEAFKGADNRFILGTNLAEGVSSQITIYGGSAAEGEGVQYVSVNDVDSALDLTNFEETLFASVNENAGITFEGVEALSARGLTLQTPGVRSETADGIVKWFFTPEGGETKPGYTPQAAHQSLDAGYYLWRSIDEGTRERFGDLRKGAAGGAWGRVSAGRLSHDGFETDYAAYRLGFDGAPSENTRLGVLFEYVDGDVDGRWGDGDSKLASGAVYGLWMSETGSYFDAGVRVGHYDASYDNKTELIDSFNLRSMAYGAWVETGHEFALSSGFFVTPHFGLNIGRIDGEDFTTDQGIRGRTDSVESAIASYGVDFGMSASAWTASASIVGKTEMLGDMAMRASTAEGSISERWSHSDTWFEAGVAAAFRPTENLQAWLNVKRSFCSEIDADWHVNVGIRRSF